MTHHRPSQAGTPCRGRTASTRTPAMVGGQLGCMRRLGRIHDLKGAGWSLMEDWWWRISCWRTQTSWTCLWTCIGNTSDFSENERISMFESADLLIETVWLLRRSWSISSSWLSKRLIRTLFSFENKPVFFYVLTTVVFSKYIEKHTFCSPGEHCNSFD